MGRAVARPTFFLGTPYFSRVTSAGVHPLRFRDLLLVALAFGLLGGLVEGAVLVATPLVSSRLSLFGVAALWLAPGAQALLFGVLAVVYGCLGAIVGWIRAPRVVVTFWAALAAFGAGTQVERIHWAAALLLAVGVGVAMSRAVGDQPVRFATRAVVALTVGLVLGAAGQRLRSGLAERAALARTPDTGAGRPNILLLVLDTVRAWNLGWYGYGRPTTPLLDRRFEQGVIFDRALATSPWTLPSHASMFTGRRQITWRLRSVSFANSGSRSMPSCWCWRRSSPRFSKLPSMTRMNGCPWFVSMKRSRCFTFWNSRSRISYEFVFLL